MTVGHFVPFAFTPTETFVYNLIRSHRSFSPVVVTRRRIHADRFPLQQEVLELSAPWDWRRVVRAARYRLLRKTRPGVFADARIAPFLRRTNVQVLHAHFGPTGWMALPARNAAGVPLITTFYGSDMSRKAREDVWKRRYAKLFVEGDLFLAEGPFMAKALEDMGCPSDRIRVHRIGIPIESFAFRERHAVTQRAARIVFCGRFVEKKGLLAALAAVATAIDAGRSIEFRVIGDGPLRARAEDMITRLGIGGSIRLLGMLAYKDVLREMEQADLMLQPSMTASDGDSEGGAPTVLLEAQAMGLPLVTSVHADIPYVVAQNVSAFLAPEGDASGLGECLINALNASKHWGSIGVAGRRFVEQRHDLMRQNEQLEEIYLSVKRGSN